jgi:hypothetical protein
MDVTGSSFSLRSNDAYDGASYKQSAVIQLTTLRGVSVNSVNISPAYNPVNSISEVFLLSLSPSHVNRLMGVGLKFSKRMDTSI